MFSSLKNMFNFIIYLFISIIPMLLVSLMLSVGNNDLLLLTIFVCSCFLIISIFSTIFLSKKYKNIAGVVKKTKFSLRNIFFFILYFIILRIVLMFINYLMIQTSNKEATINDQSLIIASNYNLSLPIVIYFLLIITIIAPINEELVFRGLFSKLFFVSEKWKSVPLFVSAILFSLFHLPDNVISFFLYFVAGVFLWFIYIRRNNINHSIMLHILNNLVYTIYFLKDLT